MARPRHAGHVFTLPPSSKAAGCCREKVRRQVHVEFNNWELEDEGGAWLEMEKADAPCDEGADWW